MLDVSADGGCEKYIHYPQSAIQHLG